MMGATGRSLAAGALAVLVGIIYLGNLPGLTGDGLDSMLAWGEWSLLAGLIVVVGTLALRANKQWLTWVMALLMAVLFMMQLLPLGLWTILYDNFSLEHPPVGAAYHWLWALPHLALAILATFEGRRFLNSSS